MISIIDYKMGNIKSVQNALSFLGAQHRIASSSEDILNSEKIILPGVGSFKQAMQNIREMGLYEVIRKVVLVQKIPLLGICLGMQLLADTGEEDGFSEGLGLIPGKVCKMNMTDSLLKIPHIGFNSVFYTEGNFLFKGLENPTDFYFVHSYHFIVNNEKHLSSYAVYGEKFAASVQKDNIFGTQFHPEKSQSNGLKVLKNFIDWNSAHA
ncbi:MAG TPA: imidazole glycerol phosphate synthase subunit HisH [Lentisphaeria bacterium]|nr:MAG: imidazole glycerol phosphate synthase, glutamine amidotransferase subunit [Lentisphaerae bacterium GWF2_38_69]HBM15424.1 imidazole glycerol phosphate synthase subunit HisH [Lentisphaeria bacterium]